MMLHDAGTWFDMHLPQVYEMLRLFEMQCREKEGLESDDNGLPAVSPV
jgi:hypothetical protein